MTGIYGKLTAHGDFVRRQLPSTFVLPWDAWLQQRLAFALHRLGDSFAHCWSVAPAIRFRLPPGLCGEAGVAGVLLASQDKVGRPFPLTLATVLAEGEPAPNEAWYTLLAQTAERARERGDAVDTLLAALPADATGGQIASSAPVPDVGWWISPAQPWTSHALPSDEQFLGLLRGDTPAARQQSAAVSHRGTVRPRNEDAFVDRGDIGVWAVADGAGGYGAGDVASAAAVAALTDLPPGLSAAEMLAQIRLRLGAVHAELQRRGEAAGSILATTVVVLIARGEHFACLWAGDSRAYLLRDGQLGQITVDHSVVQELVDAGALSAHEAEGHPQANVITRAIGSREPLALDKVSGRRQAGDRVLLCSDGLFKALSESQIATLLAAGQGPQALIDQALQAGARDNVTALVVSL